MQLGDVRFLCVRLENLSFMAWKYVFLVGIILCLTAVGRAQSNPNIRFINPSGLPNSSLMLNAEQIVQANLDAYNARDIDRFMEYFSPDVELYNFADHQPTAKGQVELRKIYQELFDASPKLHSQIVNRIVFDNKVIDHEYITGRRGSDTPVELVLIYEVKEGKIVKMTAIRK